MKPGPILIGLPGTNLDESDREHLLHPAVGGVVLFTRNFEDRAQLERLIAEIRAARNPRLLVCIDQEGGRVQRLKNGFTRLPPLGYLGRLGLDRSVPALVLRLKYETDHEAVVWLAFALARHANYAGLLGLRTVADLSAGTPVGQRAAAMRSAIAATMQSKLPNI